MNFSVSSSVTFCVQFPLSMRATEHENISQPTKKAIKEHISKLKKTLGIPGAKAASGVALSSPMKIQSKGCRKAERKPKTGLKLSNSPKGEHLDPTYSNNVKFECMCSPIGVLDFPEFPPKSKKKPQAKGRQGPGSDDDSSSNELFSIKSQDDEFRGPYTDNQTPSPTRSQAPRRAKSERKASWIEVSSTEEDAFDDESTDEIHQAVEGTARNVQQFGRQQINEEHSEAGTDSVSYDAGVMMIEQCLCYWLSVFKRWWDV